MDGLRSFARCLRGRRLCTLMGAWVVSCTVLAVVSTSASAAPQYTGLRGADRYDTAIRISQAGFASGVGAVVLATGEDFPDALSAGPLAAAYGGPVLLTPATSFDEATEAEIARLQPQRLFLVGLEPVVIQEVVAAFPDLAAAPEGIVRLVGLNRYDTARLVAEQVAQKLGGVSGVVLAPGDSFPDALSVGPLAAARGWPILLTPADGPLPDATSTALSQLQPAQLLEVGTTVDPGVPGLAVERLVGPDRYSTCALVARYSAGQGLSYAHLGIATGEKFPDGLAAGPYLARMNGLLLLAGSSGVASPVARELLDHVEELETIALIGLEPATTTQVKFLLSGNDLPEGFGFSTVSQGSRGAEVLWLEQRLTALTYRPGPVDGVFDKKTYQAVLAFQKWEGLSRDGVVGFKVWTRLLSAAPPSPSRGGSGTWIEVSKGRQVLLLVQNGGVVRTLPVSTGNASVGMVTPSGSFSITWRVGNWDGPRYKPLYLRTWGVLAIHGYPSVPAWPASHGCVRVPLWDQDELYPLIPVGTRVYIY